MASFNDDLVIPCPYCNKDKKVFLSDIPINTEAVERAYCVPCSKYFFVAVSLVPRAQVYAVVEPKEQGNAEV